MLVSITRLRLVRWTKLYRFFKLSNAAIEQAIQDPDCLAGATYSGPGLTFWTATLWKDEASMRKYVQGGAHQAMLPWLSRICSEAATTHYKTNKQELPQKTEVVKKLAQSPKFFRVEKPSAAHEAKTIPAIPPKVSRQFK